MRKVVRMNLRHGRHATAVAVIAAVACVITLTGCKMAPPKQTAVMKKSDIRLTVDAQLLRIRIRALIDPLCGIIEETADSIIAGSTDPRIRREALVWKLDAVPAMREAIFRPDALGALFDSAAFAAQMVNYFESGRGRELLGDHADTALEAALWIQSYLSETAIELTVDGSISIGESFIDDWAAEHPIEGSIAGRETVLNHVTELKRKAGLGGMKLVGSVAVTLDDLGRRIEVYSDQLLRQWRWQVELIAMDLEIEYGAHPTIAGLPALMESVNHALKVTETLPELVGREREAAIAAIDTQLTRVLEFMNSERNEVLEHLTAERFAVLEEMERVRVETILELKSELELTRAMIREEREAALDEAGTLATDAIDHAIYRLAQLVAAVVLVLLVAGGIAVTLIRRRNG